MYDDMLIRTCCACMMIYCALQDDMLWMNISTVCSMNVTCIDVLCMLILTQTTPM